MVGWFLGYGGNLWYSCVGRMEPLASDSNIHQNN
jgi:hypothetical protein